MRACLPAATLIGYTVMSPKGPAGQSTGIQINRSSSQLNKLIEQVSIRACKPVEKHGPANDGQAAISWCQKRLCWPIPLVWLIAAGLWLRRSRDWAWIPRLTHFLLHSLARHSHLSCRDALHDTAHVCSCDLKPYAATTLQDDLLLIYQQEATCS